MCAHGLFFFYSLAGGGIAAAIAVVAVVAFVFRFICCHIKVVVVVHRFSVVVFSSFEHTSSLLFGVLSSTSCRRLQWYGRMCNTAAIYSNNTFSIIIILCLLCAHTHTHQCPAHVYTRTLVQAARVRFFVRSQSRVHARLAPPCISVAPTPDQRCMRFRSCRARLFWLPQSVHIPTGIYACFVCGAFSHRKQLWRCIVTKLKLGETNKNRT